MAKKFRFSLQSVLGHREHLREQAQIALSHRLAIVEKLLGEKKILEEEQAEQVRQRPNQGSGETMMRSLAYMATLKKALEVNAKQLEDGHNEVAKARLALVEKDRDVRAMEILRDQQRETFHKQGLVLETKLLDDFGSMRALRAEGAT